MSKWQVGAHAEIMVSEHPNNAGRIVTLEESFIRNGEIHWGVKDGQPFTAYDPNARMGEPLDQRERFTSDMLGIEQWKLRLVD